MSDFFKEYNSKIKAIEDEIRKSGVVQTQTRELTITINGLPFKFKTIISGERGYTKGRISFSTSRQATFDNEQLTDGERNCKGGYIKNGVEEILNDYLSGDDYRNTITTEQNAIARNEQQIKMLEERNGKEFTEGEALKQAKEKLDEYTLKMKEEMDAKEAKYKEMDAEVEESSGISLDNDEEEEETSDGRRYDEDIEEEDKTFDNQLNAYKEGKMRSSDNLKYVDKEKALDWLAMDSPTESRQGNQGLDSAAKIIKEFENPKISTDFNTSKRRYDEETSEAQQPTEHQRRIAEHVDKLVEKLGTKDRTTVYHSLDDVPEDVRRHIEEAHKRGRKVRGWYENGHIYLFLPDIDSIYQAEKTIWHETVAHHGLRGLIGAENLDKLLRQLWLTHKDGEMGKWVTERMQKNGWKLNEAIEEYLAREAEKEPFKEPGLWQRLRWMLAEVLHKMGFAQDPTIADVQYLFWQSQNLLRSNDPMSVIKQQAFLHNLERAAANTPYVNMNAERVEDIYNPDAEGAYPDGKTIRHSEETDEEVIERLEKEPKVKVYRAMQLIDGKLYPPMAAKQNGKLVNPIELGKWEKADEHPEMADENGKFKLDKGNGKTLKAAYNPYIHTSTTMLNDQFSEAQSRPNLVVVECEVPESELTSGYKAEKAKDSVGKMDWKAGIIQGQLSGTREVILSRWDKPVRIVPTEEVAQHIYDMIKGKVEVMPTNVVTPAQLYGAELVLM